MVDEMRAVRADLAARAVFARDGERITDTRGQLAGITAPPPPAVDSTRRTAARMRQAARDGFVEVG